MAVNDGTYNVYNLNSTKNSLQIDFKMYGEQMMKIKSDKPKSVVSLNPDLVILSYSYNQENEMIHVSLKGKDIQGERGILQINY